jgi:hypothetical protein
MKVYSAKMTKTLTADRECSNCDHKWVVSEQISASSESYFGTGQAAQNANRELQKKEGGETKRLVDSDKNILCPVCNHFSKKAMATFFAGGFADWLIKAYSKSILGNAAAVIVFTPIALVLMRMGNMLATILAAPPAFFSIWCLINFLLRLMNASKMKGTVTSFPDEELQPVVVKTYKENKELAWKKVLEILCGKKSQTTPWLKFMPSGLIIMVITILGLGAYYARYDLGIAAPLKLRADYAALSKEDVGAMLKNKGFFAKEVTSQEKIIHKELSNPNGDFSNYYHSRKENGNKVIIDKATGLMWHRRGSAEKIGKRNNFKWRRLQGKMSFDDAQQWIKELNLQNYAGYSDWRLPTLEEAASLLESSKSRVTNRDELYIDSIFFKRMAGDGPISSELTGVIWSGDRHGSDSAWVVNFRLGRVESINLNHTCRVRPVRVLKE